uniref:Protein kinase domain-containing protein n=1 Tax=Opuntia streptacantha TaxID=393608 RepID=A0A7C8YWW8_OPUST
MTLLLRPPSLPPFRSFSGAGDSKSSLFPNRIRPNSSRRRLGTTSFTRASDVDSFTENSGYLFELSESEAELLAEYDIARITAVYRKKPVILARRLFQTGATLGRWFALRYIDGLMERADAMFKVRAAELRKILVELGPAYVKIAQAVSSRSDLIPPSYLEELSVLQDRINPFSNEVALNTIEQELGVAIDEIFSEISLDPVAAASLGQVYKARLRQNGRMVAVKVQRPGVKAAIALDILILRFIAGIIRRAGKFNTDLQAVVDEWASSLFREMDYRKEAQNGIKFRELYGSLPDVVVPQMYMEKTTQRVLIMEWVEGKKLAEVKDIYLIEVGVYCSFNQLLEHGFYHADPHPGNLLRTYDGKLAYLDFGMMGEFKEELRDGFIEACLHLVNRDFDALAKDFVTLGLLPPTADRDAVTKALTVAKGVQNISFGDLLGDLGTTMYKFKFRIPSYFSLVIRSLAVLEGIAISFNPAYKVLGSTYPWIARKVLVDSSPKLKSSLQSLLYKDGVFRVDRLESLLSESRRARIDKVLVKKEELDAKFAAKDIISFTLTEKGSFVREIFLEETAKGLDALGVATLNSIASFFTAYIPFPVPLPAIALTDEDFVNLMNLHSLLLLMSGLQGSGTGTKKIYSYEKQRSSLSKSNNQISSLSKNKTQRSYAVEISQLLSQLASTREIQPIIAAVNELPPEQQLQFYSLPANVLARLLSRAAARAVRRLFI